MPGSRWVQQVTLGGGCRGGDQLTRRGRGSGPRGSGAREGVAFPCRNRAPVPPVTPRCRPALPAASTRAAARTCRSGVRSRRVESLSGGSFPFLIKRLLCRGRSALVTGTDFCAVEAGLASWGAREGSHHRSDAAEQKTTNFGGVVLFIWFSLGMYPARGQRSRRGPGDAGRGLMGCMQPLSAPPSRALPLRLPTREVVEKSASKSSPLPRSGPFPRQTSAPHGAAAARSRSAALAV